MFGGPRCLESPAQLSDVAAFFALMDELLGAGTLTPENLQAEAASLYAPPDPLAGTGLQMMTIHKSKGLEFDSVIVPGLHRGTGGSDSSLLRWDQVVLADGREHLLVAPIKSRSAGDDTSTAYDYLRRLEDERSAHEDERLLYVAATRAVRSLHLVGVAVADASKDEGLKAPASGTLLDLLWANTAAAAFRYALDTGLLAESGQKGLDINSFVPDLLRLRTPQMPDVFINSEVKLPIDSNENLPEESESRIEAAVGTLVHRALELIARDGFAAWSIERISSLQPAYQRWLQQQGQPLAEAANGAQQVVAALCVTLASSAGQWVLGQQQEAAAEAAWSSQGESVAPQGDFLRGAVNHVIDRIFVAAGERWIVDYKTVKQPAHAPADFLELRAESYRPQLTRYASLFADAGLPLRLAIYYPVQGKLIELR